MRMKPAVLTVVWSVAAMCMAALGVASAPVRAQVAVPALTSPVVDTTGTLTPPQVAQLERQALGLQQRTGSQLQILIVPSTQPEDVATYAQRVFATWRLGREGVDDGVLLLIAKRDRRARIHVGTGLERAIPSDAAGRIIQTALAPRLSAGDVHGGVAEASARLVRRIESAPAPVRATEGPAPGDGLLGMLLLSGLALAFALGIAAVIHGLLTMPARAATTSAVKPRPTIEDLTPDHDWQRLSGGSDHAAPSSDWSGDGGDSRGGGASGGW